MCSTVHRERTDDLRDGGREEVKPVQKEFKVRIKQGSYRRKLEQRPLQNNVKDVWSGMRSIIADW